MARSNATAKEGPNTAGLASHLDVYLGRSTAADQRHSADTAVLLRIIRLALRYRVRVALAVAATVAAAFFQLMIPPLLGAAVDNALGLLRDGSVGATDARAALIQAALLLLGASILRGAFTLIHNYNGEAIGHLLAYDLRLAFYDKLQSLSFSFHDRVHTGELITRGMLDLDGVRMFVNTGLLRLVLLANLIGIGAYLLLSTDLILGLLSLSFVPFVAWRSSTARLRLRTLWLALQQKMAGLGQIMDENLTGIRVVRAFGAEPYEIEKYDAAADEAMTIARERIKTRVSSTTIMTYAYFVAMGLVLWVGGLRVLEGTMTVGTLTVFLTFITILQAPVRQLGLLVNAIARASTCGSRLFAVLDLQPAIDDHDSAGPLDLTDGAVRFENVSFAYAGEGAPPVLHDVSFEVHRGKSLGIVGPPGSGKSTIANLLPRYYDPSGGRITIDGQDIREVTVASLRQAVRVVQQDPFLFTASLENNIAYGDPWADYGMIQDAASVAQIDGFVDLLPDGYGTLVGERGVSLSGGQKQRVAIARATMLRSAVLIFDDSTAAIDAETEQRIRESLKAHMEDAATIIISHRLGALRHADEIVFLEAGRIVERGSHDVLIAEGGRYAALFALQSRGNDEESPAKGAAE
ncbi:MAG: ATP-binding cassette domain-containing protein [Alphaproteobacteria bacterium]|nr:ATP-binding cassette domain-containing protein [Alphaproteobacteria bacterium]